MNMPDRLPFKEFFQKKTDALAEAAERLGWKTETDDDGSYIDIHFSPKDPFLDEKLRNLSLKCVDRYGDPVFQYDTKEDNLDDFIGLVYTIDEDGMTDQLRFITPSSCFYCPATPRWIETVIRNAYRAIRSGN